MAFVTSQKMSETPPVSNRLADDLVLNRKQHHNIYILFQSRFVKNAFDLIDTGHLHNRPVYKQSHLIRNVKQRSKRTNFKAFNRVDENDPLMSESDEMTATDWLFRVAGSPPGAVTIDSLRFNRRLVSFKEMDSVDLH